MTRQLSNNRTSHLIIQVRATLEVLLGPLNEQQNVGQSADCVLITPHHHVCKSNVVASRNVTCRNLCVHWLQRITPNAIIIN